MPSIIPIRVVAVSCKACTASGLAQTATWWVLCEPFPALRWMAGSWVSHLGPLFCRDVGGVARECEMLREGRPRGAPSHTCANSASLSWHSCDEAPAAKQACMARRDRALAV